VSEANVANGGVSRRLENAGGEDDASAVPAPILQHRSVLFNIQSPGETSKIRELRSNCIYGMTIADEEDSCVGNSYCTGLTDICDMSDVASPMIIPEEEVKYCDLVHSCSNSNMICDWRNMGRGKCEGDTVSESFETCRRFCAMFSETCNHFIWDSSNQDCTMCSDSVQVTGLKTDGRIYGFECRQAAMSGASVLSEVSLNILFAVDGLYEISEVTDTLEVAVSAMGWVSKSQVGCVHSDHESGFAMNCIIATGDPAGVRGRMRRQDIVEARMQMYLTSLKVTDYKLDLVSANVQPDQEQPDHVEVEAGVVSGGSSNLTMVAAVLAACLAVIIVCCVGYFVHNKRMNNEVPSKKLSMSLSTSVGHAF